MSEIELGNIKNDGQISTIEQNTEKIAKPTVKEKEAFFSTRAISLMAIFTALSWVLYVYVKFPLPFLFPSFLDFQISDLPVLLCGFILGPSHAIIVLLLKILLKLPMSSTMYVGELADLIIGLAFILPSSLIYKIKRNTKSAVIGLSAGVLCSTAVAIFANYLFLVPFYVSFFFKGNWEILLNVVRPLYKNVSVDNFYSFYLSLAVLPFNILRGMLSAGLTLISYNSLEKSAKFIFKNPQKI